MTLRDMRFELFIQADIVRDILAVAHDSLTRRVSAVHRPLTLVQRSPARSWLMRDIRSKDDKRYECVRQTELASALSDASTWEA